MAAQGEDEMMELSGNEEEDDLGPGGPAAAGAGGGTGAYGTAGDDDVGEDEADEGEEDDDDDRPRRDPVDYELLMSVCHGLGKSMQEASTGRKVYVKDADCLGKGACQGRQACQHPGLVARSKAAKRPHALPGNWTCKRPRGASAPRPARPHACKGHM